MIATRKVPSVVPTATATFTLPIKNMISPKHVVIYIYRFCKPITNALTAPLKIYEKL